MPYWAANSAETVPEALAILREEIDLLNQCRVHLIRQQSGHASDATMARYIREGSLFRGNVAGQLL